MELIISSLSHSVPKIFALSAELVEETLVIAAARGFPSAIAAFGSSCQRFHHLVYRSTDHHLWREIFLTTFDDPRSVLKLLRNTTPIGPGEGGDDIMFDWAGEFQRRVKAERLIRKFNKHTPKVLDLFSNLDEDSLVDDPLTLTTALETIISVLETAAPLSLQYSDAILSGHTFPPIVMLHNSSTYPPECISRNSRWVDDILKCGYPPILVKRYLLARHQPSKPLKVTGDTLNAYPEEGQLFHKLVFRKGFIPVPTGSGVPWKTLQSVNDQSLSARQVARSKVYNFRYLRPERSWGPFLPANWSIRDACDKSQPNSQFPNFEQELSRYTLSSSPQGLNDSEDEDFVPAEGDHDGDEDEEEDILDLSLPRRNLDPNFVTPNPHEVRPDYNFLAAARILVEMNIREILTMNDPFVELDPAMMADWPGPVDTVNDAVVVDALASLDFNRMGGAPRFWDKSWVEADSKEKLGIPAKPTVQNSSWKGKAKAAEVEWIQGWDWAGVTGRWVRVVCWFDYRDLLLHNLDGYHGDNLSETISFFPTDLRIVGYSKPPEPDLSQLELQDLDAPVWKLPVIHIEGISHGPHDEPGTHSTRTIKGTVRMLKDGAIRWSLVRHIPNAL
ncbi:hypothetical protein C0993_009625 [Termitomyces sp. T159_Od127]|nr:hypothetical protein C0993_009625 [Termitomyces sp. T159_Od127]